MPEEIGEYSKPVVCELLGWTGANPRMRLSTSASRTMSGLYDLSSFLADVLTAACFSTFSTVSRKIKDGGLEEL